MTESEFEEEAIIPEVMPSKELQLMVKELEPTKAQILVERFSDLFSLASEWAKKAKGIVVTSGDQQETIKTARSGRLLLREKRLEIENIRKILKSDALKEGQTIDRIAGFLKDLIIPTEEHLDRQENFEKYKKEAEEKTIRLEVEKLMAEEAERKLKLEAEEKEKLRKENDKLKAEVIKKSSELQAEKKKQEDIIRLAKQNEMKAEAQKIRDEEELKKSSDIDKLIKLRNDISIISIPEVKSSDYQRIVKECESHLYLAIKKLPKTQEEE